MGNKSMLLLLQRIKDVHARAICYLYAFAVV